MEAHFLSGVPPTTAGDSAVEDLNAGPENAEPQMGNATEAFEVVEMCQWLQDWGGQLVDNQRLNTTDVLGGLQEVTDSVKEMTRAIAAQTGLLGQLIGQNDRTADRLAAAARASTPATSDASIPRTSTVSNTPSTGSATLVLAPKIFKPRFRGSVRQHPMRFLEEFEAYCRQSRVSEGDKLAAAIDCLYGSAKNWVDIYVSTWVSYADFKRDFLDSFWSESEQTQLRHDIGNDRWHPGGEETMLEHFINYVSSSKKLTMPMTEAVLVSELMRHFPPRLQSLWQVCARPTVAHAYAFLKNQAAAGVEERRPPRPFAGMPTVEQRPPRFQPYQAHTFTERRVWRNPNQTGVQRPPGNGAALNQAPKKVQPRRQ